MDKSDLRIEQLQQYLDKKKGVVESDIKEYNQQLGKNYLHFFDWHADDLYKACYMDKNYKAIQEAIDAAETHMTKTGVKERYFYDGGFKRKKPTYKSECDIMPRTIYTAGRTSLVERLKARECELCGATDDLVMHHVRKLKNLQGKESWERHMIARKRKTIAVCRSCHKKIHDGKID